MYTHTVTRATRGGLATQLKRGSGKINRMIQKKKKHNRKPVKAALIHNEDSST